MTILDGMQRVLDIHAQWLADWRRDLEMLESGKLSLHSKGPNDKDWIDETPAAIARLKSQIAMIEEIDRQYRP